MAVSFEELDGSPTMSGTGGKFRGVRKFLVDWDDWETFVTDLWGSYRYIDGALVFTPPAEFPGVPATLVTNWAAVPHGSANPSQEVDLGSDLNGDTKQYGKCEITATYEQFNDVAGGLEFSGVQGVPAITQGTILTIDGDIGADYVTLPSGIWQWAIDDVALASSDITPGIIVPNESLSMMWHRVPSPPWDTMRSLRGRVNDSYFMGHAPETVLFMGARYGRDFQIIDSGLWKISCQFAIKEVVGTVSHTGTVAAYSAGATAITLAAGASSTNDIYNDHTIEITTGPGNGQTRTILDYVGSTKVATINLSFSTPIPTVSSNYSVINKGIGHNHFLRDIDDTTGEHWHRIEDEDDNPPYKTGDLSALFVTN